MKNTQPFRLVSPNELTIKEGGGCISIFGIPFLAAGIFVTLLGLQIIPMSNASEIPIWAWGLIIFMGIVFTVVGGSLVFGRSWTTIDKNYGSITKKWGWIVPMKQQQTFISDYRFVQLSFEQGDSDTADRYPVFLKGGPGAKDLAIYSSIEYAESRIQAGFLAKFLNFPLKDVTSDHHQMLSPDTVDLSFKEAASSRRVDFEVLSRPNKMETVAEVYGNQARVTLPAKRFRFVSIFQILIPFAILLHFGPDALTFFHRTKTPEYVQIFFLGFAILLLVVLPVLSFMGTILRAMRSRIVIVVDDTGIAIHERAIVRTKTTIIPLEEILDIDFGTKQSAAISVRELSEERFASAQSELKIGDRTSRILESISKYAKSKGIIVKSVRGIFTFGEGLPDEEIQYLHALIMRALLGALEKNI